jgi:hypothetical protein
MRHAGSQAVCFLRERKNAHSELVPPDANQIFENLSACSLGFDHARLAMRWTRVSSADAMILARALRSTKSRLIVTALAIIGGPIGWTSCRRTIANSICLRVRRLVLPAINPARRDPR